MNRSEILHTAEKMVCGHREQDYGTPEHSFEAIAELWNAYLNRRCVYDCHEGGRVAVSPFDVAMMMSLFKHARIMTGSATYDSIIDACGYLACAGEIKENQHKAAVENIIDKYLKNNHLKNDAQ